METYLSIAAVLISLVIQVLIFAYLLARVNKQTPPVAVSPPPVFVTPQEEVFVSFACTNCNTTLVLSKRLYPGEVALLDCDNCQLSWTIYNPQLLIKPTKQLPEPVKVGVAQNAPMNV